MADDPMTLADLVKINDANNAERNISDLLDEAPVLALLIADTASNGTSHKYLKQTGAPVVGFRDVNAGRALDRSADTQVTIDLTILDASYRIDKALADGHNKGPVALIAREGSRHLKAAFSLFEKQVLGGTDNDATGFAGLADSLGLDSSMVYDALGTTASTGSSVYAIRTSIDDVVAIMGQNGQITIGETTIVDALTTDSPPKHFPAYYTPVDGWVGLQIGGAYSVGRICNITEDSSHTLTDDMIAELLALFPASRQPTFLAMNRRSRKQLQQSRTATNATGAPAPFPTEAFGVPIVPTDSILSTEDILSGT